MNRTRLHLALPLALLLVGSVVAPLFAASPQAAAVQSACGVQLGVAAPAMSLIPAPIHVATPPRDFSLQYIGQCCTNNDASLCPPVPGYGTVHCALPMCGGGLLSCVYQ